MTPDDKPAFYTYTPAGLAKLWRENPDLFNELAADAKRRACIGSTPDSALKLRHLQWVIDTQLRKGKTPLAKMHIMENVFYARVFGEDGDLAKLSVEWNKVLGAMMVAGHGYGTKPGMRLVKK